MIAECKDCGCMFCYEKEDKYCARIHMNEYEYYVKCPQCETHITISMSQEKHEQKTECVYCNNYHALAFEDDPCESCLSESYPCTSCNRKIAYINKISKAVFKGMKYCDQCGQKL